MIERRDELKKFTEVLIRAREKIAPTRLQSDSRLDYRQFAKLIKRLFKLRFLELLPTNNKNRRALGFYRTTEEGEYFLETAIKCYTMIDDNYIKNMIRKIKVF